MIQLPKKDNYRIGIMTGSFHTDYSRRITDAICDGLMREETSTDVFLFQGFDATRYLSFREEVAKSFDSHYYALFEYAKYIRPDLLIISFGTISAVPDPMEIAAFLDPFKDIPVILLEDDTTITNGIHITVDNYQGMYDCVTHLIRDHGCKKLLYLSGPKDVPDSKQRLAGYRDALKDNGIAATNDMIAYGNFTDRVEDLVDGLLLRTPNADACICANDEMAESAYRVLVSRGLSPGRDISVTGFDDNAIAGYMNPPLTTVRQDFSLVAESVVKTLHRLLAGEEVHSEVIPAQLIKRHSCGCLQRVQAPAAEKEESETRATEDRVKIKNLQNRNIMSTLFLRGLLTAGISSETFFRRIGEMLQNVGTRQARICLTEKPVSAPDKATYFLPDTLKLYLELKGDQIEAYGFENAPDLGSAALYDATDVPDASGMQNAVFTLFCNKKHYGVLCVRISRSEMLFYYTLSLQIGTAIRYLRMALENATR